MSTSLTQRVIAANIAVHSKLAAHYQSCEPHFRPENTEKVGRRIAALVQETRAESLLADSDSLGRHGASLYEFAAANWSWTRAAELYAAVFKRLAS